MKEYINFIAYVLLMIVMLAFASAIIVYLTNDMNVEAKSKKSKYKVIGYEYKIVKAKVKVKKKKYLGKFYITHYCPCEQCCGVGGGKITASGTVPTAGRTVGVNPAVIPYGTKLKIGGKEGYVAEDTGGGIGTYHIDIFCNSHQEALNAGVGYKKVYAIIYKWKTRKVKVKIPIYEKR